MAKSMKKGDYEAYFRSVLEEYNDTPLMQRFPQLIEKMKEIAISGADAKNMAQREEIYSQIRTIETQLKDELNVYIQNVLNDYQKTSPLAAYFPQDIDKIVQIAESALQPDLSLNDMQGILGELDAEIQTFNNKIDACLGEVVSNFKAKGATSSLTGTFYYTAGKNGDGKALEETIVGYAKGGLQASTFKAKEAAFLGAIDAFNQYVENSTLTSLIEEAKNEDIDATKLTLTEVYKNSLSVESKLGYRSDKYVRAVFDKNPKNSHEVAMPFRYYTILAGIKLGKINKVTTELLDDLKWIKKGVPGLLPPGIDPEDPQLKSNPELQKTFLKTLSDQYSETELKDKLVQARTNFLNDDVVKLANTERTGAFHMGRMTVPRILSMAGVTAAITFAFGAAMLLLTGMNGLENGFVEQLFQIMSSPINVFAYGALPLTMDAISTIVSHHRSEDFKNKYNKLNTKEKSQLTRDIEKVLQIEDKKAKEAAIEKLNAKYNGLFGEKKSQIMENYNMLERSIKSYQGRIQRSILKPLERKAGKESKSEISIKNKGDIMNFIQSLGISQDNPFFSIVDNVINQISGRTKGKTTALAYQTITYNPTPTVTHPSNTQPVVDTVVQTVSNENENPIVDVVSTADVELTRGLKVVKEKILDELSRGKTIELGELGYEIQIVKTGITSRISGLDDQLKKVLQRIESTIRESDEEEFIIQNDKSKKPFQLGKISLGKSVTAGADTVTIKVTKKKPITGPRQ